MNVQFTLNGKPKRWDVDPIAMLDQCLREKGILSIKNGCDGEGSCGLCLVILNGKTVNSCQILAANLQASQLWTVEGFCQDKKLSLIQRALVDSSAVQCGYCSPSVVLALHNLLERCPSPDRKDIQDALSGILCRCTGYEQFFQAVRLAVARQHNPQYSEKAPQEFKPELRHIGKDRDKIDAAYLVRGERAFVEDKLDPDACYLALLTSPVAHAWIKKIDTSKAEALPGVITIITHLNCPPHTYTTAGQGFPEPSPHDARMFSSKVRYVGDRVAAVLAESIHIANAALDLIEVDYEIITPVLSIQDAQAAQSIVHSGEVVYVTGTAPKGSSTKGDGRDDPIVYQFPLHADPHRNLAASADGGIGDIEAGFKEADHVIEREYRANRVQCTPMEPHVVYARTEADRLVIRASTQVPWHVRRIVARAIGIPENKVRIIKERVGGGFGAKQDIVVEDIAGYIAWKTGKPVFFRFTRNLEFISSRTRHAMEIKVKMGARKDGTLTAILMDVQADTGAYGQHCLTVPMNSVSKSIPLLLCDNVQFQVRSWYTNLGLAGAYQGYGAPQGSFAIQTCLAELAHLLGIEQLAMIEKNRVRSNTRIEILRCLGEGRPGQAVDLGECGLGEMLLRGKKALHWDAPKRNPQTLPELKGEGWHIGRAGVIVQQGSGLPGIDAANAEIRLLSDGGALLLSGAADIGTGLDTLTAKAATEILGLDIDDITVISGDTDTTPFDKGAYASSGTFFSGNAALLAAKDLKLKILKAASEVLEEPTENLQIKYRGIVQGKNSSITLAQLGHRSIQGVGFPELVGLGHFKTDHSAFPYGAHFTEVAANSRTGEVRVLRFHVYQDCGTPLNPGLALGQIYGGILKSIGHSLYEELIYDEKGRCLTSNFLDYKIPSIKEVPDDFHVEFVPIEDEVGPFGGKSISEISLNGSAPVLAIAIHDALGVWVREWPFTPERILKALGTL